jgi:hypothetical protein
VHVASPFFLSVAFVLSLSGEFVMPKVVETHVVVTAQAFGGFRHGQVVAVENLPNGDYWKGYLNDGLRYATDAEVGKEFVVVTPDKHTPTSVETDLAEAKKTIRLKQIRIDQLELEQSRLHNDKAQAESPALLAGKDKEIKELKVALSDAQQKLAKVQSENIALKQQVAVSANTQQPVVNVGQGGTPGTTTPSTTNPTSEPPAPEGPADPAAATNDGPKPNVNGKGKK